MANTSAASSSGSNGKRRKLVLDLDTGCLECAHGSRIFSSPVFQCRNGHNLCFECSVMKLTTGCSACYKPVGWMRNFSLEKIIDSTWVKCTHARKGCATKVWYTDRPQMEEHENKQCEYRPLLCPVQSPRQCVYIGPGVTIPTHLAEEHGVPVLESCLETGQSAHITLKATCPMAMIKTEKAWLLVNCWAGPLHFGTYVFCSVYGSSTVRLLHSLSIERVRLRNEERQHLTIAPLQAEALKHCDLVFEDTTVEDILNGPYINIPNEAEEAPDLEFDLKVTVMGDVSE